jgi:HEPN domain-containing protein
MDIDSKIISRFTDLIELGDKVRATRREPSPGHLTGDFVDIQIANQWFASCLNLLSRVFGESSIQFTSFSKHSDKYLKWSNVGQAFGVLLAAKDDYESDSLFDVKQLIEAELFDDFLEQAEFLLQSGYYQPAAVIAGSVLEDGLRKLCVKHDIKLPDKPKLDWMNAQLAKQGVYNKLTQKTVTAMADIRNSAAHGKWDDFEEEDVEELIKYVRSFMERNYA